MATTFKNFAANAVGLHDTESNPHIAAPYNGTVTLNPDMTSQSVIDGLVGSGAAEISTINPPEIIIAPVITGTARVGSVLNGSNGQWTGEPSFTREWLRAGAPISGATGQTYTVVAADLGALISIRVKATNAAGELSATSAAVGPVAAALTPPSNTGLPTVSGTAQEGQTLTATNGAWSGSTPITYAHQWTADAANIAGATGQTYKLTAAEIGKQIRVRVTATNSQGNAQATSAPSAAVTPAPSAPTMQTAPTASGVPTVGETLAGTDGVWVGVPAPTITRVWRADGQDIAGANGSTYVLTAAEVGKTIVFRVTATNTVGADGANSNGLGPVAALVEPE